MDIPYVSEGHKRFLKWWRKKGWTVAQLAQALVLDELCTRRIIRGNMAPSMPTQCRIHELTKEDQAGPIYLSLWAMEPRRYPRRKETAG